MTEPSPANAAPPPQDEPAAAPATTGSGDVVHTIATAEAWAELLRTHTYVAVDFHATWCGPCKAVAPLFAAHAAKHAAPGAFAFARVDIDDVPDVARRYRVAAVPTFVFVKDGEEFEELKGPNPARLQREVESVARELAESQGAANAVATALEGEQDW